ncbi:SMAD/FHA domain-containing protein [Podospora appendiculata]|uniref:SMAD/FHA domain-containing protein n=1 Tax=Podospora appendiculata TaxID=314037 RepID=A0AAE0XBS8_9PEZI|nr:SMAD/FHA domain-containing protein [Podospora appendiculata]
MGSDRVESDSRSRRRKYDDDVQGSESERKRRRDEKEPDRHSRRYRSREREREHRRRSRSPGPTRDRRSRSRDKERKSEGARESGRSTDKGRDKEAERDNEKRQDRYPDERRRRDRDRDQDQDGNPESDRRDSRRQRSRRSKADSKRSLVKRSGPLPSQGDQFAVTTGEEPEKPVEKPNFGNSGTLAAVSNAVAQADGTTITLKYHEPPEARKPAPRDVWKLFVFKGPDIVDTVELSARSCWLVGRETAVVDLQAEHPSISKQHAVIQFRYTEKRNEFGDKIGRVKPYLIDLESANGTALNGEKVPESRYLELRDKDMIQFGSSTREYVLMLAPRD